MAFDLNDPETKEAVAKLIADAKEGIEAKNSELLAEVKKLKADIRKTQDIKPEDLAALEAERDTLAAKLASTEKAAKDAQKAAETAQKALEAESGVTHKLLAENGLMAELTKAGISDPDFLAAAKAMHIGSVKVIAEGEERKAMYGDKPIADAIKEWASTDTAKKFISAPANSGGGANGSGGAKGNEKTVLRSQFDTMSHAERATFAKEGGKVVDAAA